MITCIMPTADRRAFVPLAIQAFLRQDYEARELLILDDGADPIADLIPPDHRIRYKRLDTRLSLGLKRNMGCELAAGDLIAHWDDDDWSAPWRLSAQVRALDETGADACGLAELWFYDPIARRAWQYRYPPDGSCWVAGGTLCYRKSLWQTHPFADVQVGEDTRFVWSLTTARVVPLADSRFYVATIHRGNTSPRQTDDPRFVEGAPAVVEALLGDDLPGMLAACGGTPLPTPRAEPRRRSEDGRPRKLRRAARRRPRREITVGVYVCGLGHRLDATLASLSREAAGASIVLLPDGAEAAMAARAFPGCPQLPVDPPRGRAAAFNRLAAFNDTSDVLLFLESGVVGSAGCLDRLQDALASQPEIGLAGPSTNLAWNEQRLADAPAFDAPGDAIDAFAGALAGRFGTECSALEPLYSLCDFAYVVKRSVVDAIGAADEAYGLGPCWEMDYNVRAARAGFRGVWVRAAYAHRAPAPSAHLRDEELEFESSKRRYQDKFCALRLRRERVEYEPHCRGEACEHFAPGGLIQLKLPMPRPVRAAVQAPVAAVIAPPASCAVQAPAAVSAPLVSCIMPTGNRRELLLQSIRYFERQDYPSRELIIVDDGETDLSACVPAASGIRYVRVPPGESIGAKRNRACELARGEFIVQWDDDDWYGAGRLSAQVAPLVAGEADITGLSADVVFESQSWRFWTCTPDLHARMFFGDVHGGTLAYGRRVWENLSRYPDISLAEDAVFLRQAIASGARLRKVPGSGIFIYLRHGGNIWSFDCGQHVDAQGWRQIEEPAELARDRSFYQALFRPGQEEIPPPAAPATATREPLVSCIMPTANRRLFVPQAIRYFLRQSYPRRELIVVDDGEDAVADLIPCDPRVRYVRLDRRLSLGEKRNLAVRESRGEVIAHWDDDDWYHSAYLSETARRLVDCGTRRAVCGVGTYLVWILGDSELRICQTSGIVGATFAYFRSVWEEHPYRDVEAAEDFFFLEDARPTFVFLDGPSLFVVVRHRYHTWTTDSGWDVTTQLRMLPGYGKPLNEVVDIDDVMFYEHAARMVAERPR